MKRRIVLRRLGRYTQLWAEAKALQTPRSTYSISDEFQKAYNTRRAIKLAVRYRDKKRNGSSGSCSTQGDAASSE